MRMCSCVDNTQQPFLIYKLRCRYLTSILTLHRTEALIQSHLETDLPSIASFPPVFLSLQSPNISVIPKAHHEGPVHSQRLSFGPLRRLLTGWHPRRDSGGPSI